MNWKLFGLGASFIIGAMFILMNIFYGLPTVGIGIASPFLYFSSWCMYEGIKLYRKACS